MARVRYLKSQIATKAKNKDKEEKNRHWVFREGQKEYRTRAIITRGLYIFYPILEGQKRFLRSFIVNFYLIVNNMT